MYKFKIPNTGLKQYSKLTAEQFFTEVYKRNETKIKESTGGLINEEQWVGRMESIAKSTGMSPKEAIKAEAERKIYLSENEYSAIQARKALEGSYRDGKSAYTWLRQNARDARGRFVSPSSGEWLSGGYYQIGKYRLDFRDSPRIIIAQIYNEKTGTWEDKETFDEAPEDNRAIQRRKGKIG